MGNFFENLFDPLKYWLVDIIVTAGVKLPKEPSVRDCIVTGGEKLVKKPSVWGVAAAFSAFSAAVYGVATLMIDKMKMPKTLKYVKNRKREIIGGASVDSEIIEKQLEIEELNRPNNI
ncbi:hypothetical protein OROMI_012497 [Orobanche minor]